MGSEPVERLAAESVEARNRIAATIDEIQDRIDPRRIVNEAASKAVVGSRQAVSVVAETARAHPLAIGAGIVAIGLALLARDRLSKATVNLGDDLAAYTDYDDGYGYDEAAYVATNDDDDTPPVRKRGIIAKSSDTVEANPIVAIIVGLAAGAAFGALFPTTEAERKLMGEAGDRLGDAARRAVDGIGKRI